MLNHDDDILAYWLFEGGELADEYNSCPGYFSGGDEIPAGGDATKLCAAFGVAAKAKQIEQVLRDRNTSSRSTVIGIWWNSLTSRGLMSAWDTATSRMVGFPKGVSKKDLLAIG